MGSLKNASSSDELLAIFVGVSAGCHSRATGRGGDGMRDIYFPEREIKEPTAEHVLPNGLGGRWKVPGLIDRTTNSGFGETIDAALQRGLASFRTLLGAVSGDKRPPPMLRNQSADDGNRYDVLPEGELALANPSFRVWVEDGLLHATGTVRSPKDARRLVRRIFQKHGVSLDRLDALTVNTTQQVAPKLQLAVELDEGGRRAIAKMACNLFASGHRDLFVRPDFDDVRRHVAVGGGNHVAICGPLPSEPSIGDFDHLILVTGTASSGRVTGLVRLYGHLNFVVELGTTNLPNDVGLSYRVDPIRGKQRRHEQEDLAPTIPPFVADDGPQGAVWLAAVTDLLRATIRHLEMSRTFKECWNDVLGKKAEGEEITEAEIRALAHTVIERFIPRFYRVRTRD